ncbi:MAG: hypothetical protein CMJ76_08345 [Planctomycetaceae bacterium]|nr:hypothetical protein [Planctomycetaceae bacterium]
MPVLTVAAVLAIAPQLFGQPVPAKTPDSVHLFPAGGQRGSTVKVRVGLEQSPPNTQFFIRGKGVSGDSILAQEVFDDGQPSPRRIPTETPINYPRQWDAEVVIDADARLGAATWDTFCASGGSSGSLPFIVGDLPELIENESNSTLSTAHHIEIPVTVNGQIHGERDLDYYRLELQTGEVLYGEVLARRLGSKLEPTIAIFDAAGKQHTYQEDSLGDDLLFAFKAKEAGTYFIQVGNVSFHGSPSHIYRINFTRKPVAPYAFPIGAPAGIATNFRFLVMDGEGGTFTISKEYVLDGEIDSFQAFRDDSLANRPLLRVLPPDAKIINAHPTSQDSELNIHVGETANGIIAPFSKDIYKLTVTDKSPIDLTVHAASQSSSASLIILNIKDANGKLLKKTGLSAKSDSVKAFHHLVNPHLGEYLIEVQCLGGIRSKHRVGSYQLEISAAVPDFSLRSARDCVTITQGMSLEIPVQLNRLGGFKGEVKLIISGLPEGVTIENNIIAEGADTTKLKLTLPADEPSTRHEIRLLGESVINDETVSRPLYALHRGVDSFQQAVESPHRGFIALAVAHKPVFRLYCEEAYQYAHRGTIYPYQMTLERLDEFQEPVIIQTCDRQNRDMDGIEFVTTVIEPDTSVFMMPIFLPETMHINIQSQSQLYTQAYATFVDSHGTQQHVMVVSEKRNMIRTMPTVTKLYNRSGELVGKAGENIVVKLEMQRTSNMLNAMQLNAKSKTPLLVDLFAGLDFKKGQRTLETPVTIPADLSPGRHRLILEATGPLDDKPDHIVVTSVMLELVVLAEQ